jgi:SAM-dependent methyltransferase
MSVGHRARLEREQAFHDDRFTDDGGRSGAKKYYSVTRASSSRLGRALEAIPAGARALELGCGLTNHAMPLAERGVEVCAIDISPVAVAEMRRRVVDTGLGHLVTTQVMNAEELAFTAGSFDLVVGTGILHHLDLSLVYPQIARVLRPGGVGAFVEPLGRNPLINLYRSLTPGMRTPDEHPLVESDFAMAREWFENVEVSYFHAATLLSVPFRRTRYFESVLGRLEGIDSYAFERVPVTRTLAWTCVLELTRSQSSEVKA